MKYINFLIEYLLREDIFIAFVGAISSGLLAYFVTRSTINRDKKKGKYILLEIIKRYIIALDSCWDDEAQKFKNDIGTIGSYKRILEGVENDLIELSSNTYFISIVSKYSEITIVQVFVTIEMSDLNNSIFKPKHGTFENFRDLFNRIKKDFPQKTFQRDEFLKLINIKFEEYDKILNNVIYE